MSEVLYFIGCMIVASVLVSLSYRVERWVRRNLS